jgi:hypothetical protein
MHNEITVSKWGDSLAVRIPQAIAIQAHISEGDSLAMELSLSTRWGAMASNIPQMSSAELTSSPVFSRSFLQMSSALNPYF